MVVVSSLLALVFGLSLGLLFENILVLVGVTFVIPCLHHVRNLLCRCADWRSNRTGRLG